MGKKSRRPAQQADANKSKPNLFETKLGSKKQEVLGKRSKHGTDKLRSGWSQGVDKRKGTLLVEYKLRNKGNSFVDRRIGEHDNTLSEDDKAIARFQKQRFKDMIAGQSTRITGEEEPLFQLGSRCEAEVAGFDDPDEAEDMMHDKILPDADFGGGFVRKDTEGEPGMEEQTKSKKQVMEEIIAKSKAFKAEKAKQRDADLDETEALDRDLNLLMQDGLLHNLLRKKGAAPAQKTLNDEELEYDKDRRGLIFEAKAKAGTKLEVPQEDAHQDKMAQPESHPPHGTDEDAEAFTPLKDTLPSGGYALRRAKLRQRQEAEARDGEDAGESDEEVDGSEEESEPGSSDRSDSEAEDEQPSTIPDRAAVARDEPEARRRETANTFPETYDAYLSRAAQRQPDKVDSALQALRSTVKNVAEDEGRRLQMLCGYMIQHFADRAGATPLPMEELDVLSRHIVELCAEVPLYAVSAAQARLSRLQQRLADTLNPTAEDGAGKGEVGWPSQRQLLVLKLLTTVFMTSDRRHHVLTPLTLIIAGYLKLCPVTSKEDVKAGLFLSALGLHIVAASERIMPEPLAFSINVVRHATGITATSEPGNFGALPTWSSDTATTGQPATPLLCLREGHQSEQHWSSLLSAAMGVIERSSELFLEAESFPEMFTAALDLLQQLDSQQLPKGVDLQRGQLYSVVSRRCKDFQRNRKPLQKEKVIKEVKQFNPRFEEEFAAGKNYDPDRDRAEARKLKRKLAKEQRSAVRELRKDAVFLGDEVDKERDAQDQERKNTLRKNTAWLQRQEADFKSGGQGGLWKKHKRR